MVVVTVATTLFAGSMKLTLKQANVEDYQTILDLVTEAARWLRCKGTDQWNTPWPSEEERNKRIYRSLADGTTWIAWDGCIAVATVTLHAQSLPWLWMDDESQEPAIYMHRLVVNRHYAGKGIGAKVVDWVCRRATAQGARYVRIDVWTTNVALHRYYENIGFVKVREAPENELCPGYPSRMLFERFVQPS